MAGLPRVSENQQPIAGGSDGRLAYQPPNVPPVTSYAETRSPLFSATGKNAEYSDPRNAPIVDRHFRRNGIDNVYVRGGIPEEVRFIADPPRSSRFQQTLVRLWPWSINRGWYIAYPAATVMNGGARNLGLSERTPQISTRTAGGPGNIQMSSRPQYTKVLQVPRPPTNPQSMVPKPAKG